MLTLSSLENMEMWTMMSSRFGVRTSNITPTHKMADFYLESYKQVRSLSELPRRFAYGPESQVSMSPLLGQICEL